MLFLLALALFMLVFIFGLTYKSKGFDAAFITTGAALMILIILYAGASVIVSLID